MGSMVKAKAIIALGAGRVNMCGFDPNDCNFSIEHIGDELVYLDELITNAECFCELYGKLFGDELNYILKIEKTNGERSVTIEFKD